MPDNFCLNCFSTISTMEEVCPACKVPIAAISAREYAEKLIRALEHPLADVRVRVIIALGMRGDPEAAEKLADCALHYPADIVQSIQIVTSLRKMRPSTSRHKALEALGKQHPAAVVRIAAMAALTQPTDQ